MGQRAGGRRTAPAIVALALLIAGCSNGGIDVYRLVGPYQNHVISSDANSVQIQYLGDVEATVPLARQRCAQYAKVPEQISISGGVVTYLCRDAGSAPGQLHGELNSKLTLITALLMPSRR